MPVSRGETFAQTHWVGYENRTTSYSTGSSILVDVIFNRPVTATGSVLQLELGAGKVVSAILDTASDGESVLKYSHVIEASDDTSVLKVKTIVGTLKAKSQTAITFGDVDIR